MSAAYAGRGCATCGSGGHRPKDEQRAPRGELCLRNRQRARPVNLELLVEIARHLLARHFPHHRFTLGIHLVAPPEMTRLNEHFLHHAGSTDVITFDYADRATPAFSPVVSGARTRAAGRCDLGPVLSGEICICLDEAVTQALRFRTTWQSEVARYLVHGLLHLHGYDDAGPAARLKMKRAENRWLRDVSRRFRLDRLACPPRAAKHRCQGQR